ncbi:cyclic-di-AMP receptor [Treponema brennaborense]|uniref:Nitrogen regulatory protein P-II n=1 Tax=Treponema brennaborense (strain DSM 12168 / CIP 105900 / DD5/3) TaxID=906968 RepID=F4LMQ9_TREBD|nr:cyclic-di-AMP receptor [Treponema brennaborense]AEE17799.1 protein of unknown function DUF970 [Treponema brennaborense DSM 12168]
MKMILAIIQEKDEIETVDELNRNRFYVTKLATTGGFLKEKNVTLMVGVEDGELDQAIACIKATARTRRTISYTMPFNAIGMINPALTPLVSQPVTVGGCTIFVLPVEQFIKD